MSVTALPKPTTEAAHLAYLAAVRRLPCIVCRCDNRDIEAHHAGKNPGVGLKAPDITAVPLCRRHHRMITGIVGGYGIWDWLGEDGRREMQDNWIRETQRRLVAVLVGPREIAPF